MAGGARAAGRQTPRPHSAPGRCGRGSRRGGRGPPRARAGARRGSALAARGRDDRRRRARRGCARQPVRSRRRRAPRLRPRFRHRGHEQPARPGFAAGAASRRSIRTRPSRRPSSSTATSTALSNDSLGGRRDLPAVASGPARGTVGSGWTFTRDASSAPRPLASQRGSRRQWSRFFARPARTEQRRARRYERGQQRLRVAQFHAASLFAGAGFGIGAVYARGCGFSAGVIGAGHDGGPRELVHAHHVRDGHTSAA